MKRYLAGCFLLFSSVFCLAQALTPQQQLDRLLKDEWEFEMRNSPEAATYQGDHRYDDRLSDYSAQAFRATAAEKKRFIARADAIDASKLDEAGSLNLKLFKRALQQDVDEAAFEPWTMPVSQFDGPHVGFAELAHSTVFRNAGDYDHYLARLKQIPRALD